MEQKRITQTIDLGENGLIPLEVRFHHDPNSPHGFVGAALSSTIWHWYKDGDQWKADNVISVPSQEVDGWDIPVPGLITDLVLSMDDRWLYFSDWLHGDIRQYDVSDPSKPRLTGQVWLGGLLGKPSAWDGKKLDGGPQMLQLSLDGRRLYVTNSLFSSWDNQFYPEIGKNGSSLLEIDCDTQKGGLTLNKHSLSISERSPMAPSEPMKSASRSEIRPPISGPDQGAITDAGKPRRQPRRWHPFCLLLHLHREAPSGSRGVRTIRRTSARAPWIAPTGRISRR